VTPTRTPERAVPAPAPTGFPFPPRRGAWRRPRLAHADFHTSWRSELRLWNSTAKRATMVVATLVLLAAPVLLDRVWLRVLVLSLIAGIAAMSLNLLTGVAGQLSLGHAAFVGMGAYTAAFVTGNLEAAFWWSLPASMAVAGLAGLVLAPVALRVRGLYLAVVTLGLVFLSQHLFRNWTTVTGGVGGARIETPTLFGVDLIRGGELGPITLTQNQGYYLVVLVITGASYLLLRNIVRGRTGRDMAAVRDNDLAAGVVGVGVFGAKVRAFVISSAFAGLSGALLGGFLRFINYDQWSLLLSVEFLVMVALGGTGILGAALLGALFVTLVPEILDQLAPHIPWLSEAGTGLTPPRASAILFGLLLALVIVVEPLGLYGLWLRIRRYLTTWPF
jgi:branched-chain amino acid transport system permease protein